MKIPIDKQIAFLKKLIEETKSYDVYWQRLPQNSSIAIDTFPCDNIDPEGVFSCGFRRSLDIKLLIAMCNDGIVKGSIGTDYDYMVPLSHENEEVGVLLIRLFNIIFEMRPNVNKLIDEYLSLTSKQDTDL